MAGAAGCLEAQPNKCKARRANQQQTAQQTDTFFKRWNMVPSLIANGALQIVRTNDYNAESAYQMTSYMPYVFLANWRLNDRSAKY